MGLVLGMGYSPNSYHTTFQDGLFTISTAYPHRLTLALPLALPPSFPSVEKRNFTCRSGHSLHITPYFTRPLNSCLPAGRSTPAMISYICTALLPSPASNTPPLSNTPIPSFPFPVTLPRMNTEPSRTHPDTRRKEYPVHGNAARRVTETSGTDGQEKKKGGTKKVRIRGARMHCSAAASPGSPLSPAG